MGGREGREEQCGEREECGMGRGKGGVVEREKGGKGGVVWGGRSGIHMSVDFACVLRIWQVCVCVEEVGRRGGKSEVAW